MKILFLNYEFPPLGGGASPISYEIAERYAQRGHKVAVFTMGFEGLPAFEQKNGLDIHRIACWRSKKELCHPHEMLSFIIKARKPLFDFLKKERFDVCHNHFAIPTGILALQVKKKFGIPFINTSHGSDIPGYNEERFTFLHHFTLPILKRVLNGSSGNFSGSNYLAGLGNSRITPPVPYKVIREGFDPTQFEPKKKKNIILSTGRLLRRKGFLELVEAASHKDLGYEIHICGDGPVMDELKAKADNSKTKVVLHGWLNNKSEKYKNLLESAAIYSLVSSKENASKSLLEAMSAGCATITSNVAGCPESVGDAGIAILPVDVAKLRTVLEDLCANKDKVEALGKKGRERILNTYNWEKGITQYENVLQSLIKQ